MATKKADSKKFSKVAHKKVAKEVSKVEKIVRKIKYFLLKKSQNQVLFQQ